MMSSGGFSGTAPAGAFPSGDDPQKDPPKKNLKRGASDEEWREVCPYCREYAYHPVKTSCGHTFCYSCLKGSSPLCGICRGEYDQTVFNTKQQINIFEAVNPNYTNAPYRDGLALVQERDTDELKMVDVKPDVDVLKAQMAAAAAAGQPLPQPDVVFAHRPMIASRNANFIWLYKCRSSHVFGAEQKWWRYNGRIELEIERAFQEGKFSVRVFLCGRFYTIDFTTFIQHHETMPERNRHIQRVPAEYFKDYNVIGIEGIETPAVWEVQ